MNSRSTFPLFATDLALALCALNGIAGASQAVECQGSSCLRVTAVRRGTRCGKPSSIEFDVQNISSENLRGYVVVDTTAGKRYEPTGLLAPGREMRGVIFTCDATGGYSVVANVGADPRYPPRTDTVTAGSQDRANRQMASLEYECDANPDDLEHTCNVRKLECNENSRQWCDSSSQRKGQKGTHAYKAQYDRCLSEHVRSCGKEQVRCLSNIRKCPGGQRCSSSGLCEMRQ